MARNNYRGSNKMQPKDQKVEKENMQGIKPLDMAVTPDQVSAYSTSGAVTDVGGTASADNLYVRKIPVSLQDLLFNGSSTSVNQLLDGELGELINSYATARGYITSVTVAKVQDYLDASAHYISILLWLYKAQNAKNLKGFDGFNIGQLFGIRPTTAIDEDDVADYVVNATSVSTTVVDDAAVSINNTVWADILSQLPHIRLSAPILGQLISLFGVDYMVKNNGASTVYQLMDATLFSGSTAQALLAGFATTLTNLRQADKDIADILEFLGFSSNFAIDLDFTRDQRGLTHSIVYDPEFDAIRVNSAIDFGGYQANDTDRFNVYYDIEGVSDFFNFETAKELSASKILKHKLLDAWGPTATSSAVGPHYAAYVWTSGSASYVFKLFFPYSVDFAISDPITSAMTIRAYQITADTFLSGSGFLPIRYVGTWRQLVPGGSAGFAAGVITTVFEGFNTYLFDAEGMKFYRLAKQAEMWMNGVEYRTALQRLMNSVRPMSVNKQN